ncbi:hypothetical protein ACFYKX_12095 [Cytobacillus sp. FJAT-54145]|uniref:Exosporium protein E n=1 Tax=Cytobacillus spartinae TaxID=3299023 RepID=A0ABW6KAY5_9BACI
MRTWRVGTISMGIALLFLGIYLLFSQILGLDMLHVMISWLPIILVVLGIEILVYLFLSRQEKPLLKYDFLSIFFVGILGTLGIAFAVLNTTGLLDIMDDVLGREEKTYELPSFTKEVSEDIKRVVLHTERYPVTVESTIDKEVSMFGTYRASTSKNKELISEADDYVSALQKGDTLYITIKGLPENYRGPFDFYSTMVATVLVPTNVKLEVTGNDNPITIKPRTLMSDWNVESASSISLHLEKNSDVTVSAVGIQELVSQENEWTVTSGHTEDSNPEFNEIEEGYAYPEGNNHFKNASYKMGKGTHQLNISNSFKVSLNTLK